MSQFNLPGTQYVLSLDNLDLSLLRLSVEKSHDEKRTLWSKPFMDGEATYCQVKIGSEETWYDETQADNCYLDTPEYYKCHICNIDVPQIYYKQHIESRLHHSYKKLTEIMLENVSKQLNVYVNTVDGKEQTNQFFCNICSKVMSVQYRQTHNTSKYHLKSIENQVLVDNFIEIYTGSKANDKREKENNNNIQVKDNTKIQSECFQNKNTDQIRDSESESESETNSPKNYNHKFFINNIINTPELSNIYESPSSDNGSIEDDNTVCTLSNARNIASFYLHLKEMIAKYKLQLKVPILEDNSIVIVTPKGYKKKVTINSYHGYKIINSFIYCQLCKTWVDNHVNHIMTENHARNIAQPVNDDFVRDVIFNNDKWSHCLVCNVMVPKGSNHVAISHEQYNEASTSITKAIQVHTNNTRKITYSDICKQQHNEADDYSNHSESNKSGNNLNTTNINKSSNIEDVVSTSGINSINNNKEYCEICQVQVRNSDMGTHKKGKRHKNKSLNLNKSTYEPKKNKDLLNTSKCTSNVAVPPKNMSEITFEEKLFEYNKQMAHFNANELKCLVCDVKIPNIGKDIIEHMEGAKHQKYMNTLLLITKIVRKSPKHFYCELCKYDIENFIDHIIQDVNHKIKYQTVFRTELKEYVYDDPFNRDPLACEYRKIYEDMLVRHKIVRLNDNLSSHCNVCSITLLRINEIDHMLSGWHKSSL